MIFDYQESNEKFFKAIKLSQVFEECVVVSVHFSRIFHKPLHPKVGFIFKKAHV